AAPSSSAVARILLIAVPLHRSMASTVARRPWLIAERSNASTARDHPVDEQKEERADNGRDEARPLILAIPAHVVADPTGKESAGNSQEHGDDAAAGIFARHQQLGDSPREAADDNPADDPVMLHSLALSHSPSS